MWYLDIRPGLTSDNSSTQHPHYLPSNLHNATIIRSLCRMRGSDSERFPKRAMLRASSTLSRSQFNYSSSLFYGDTDLRFTRSCNCALLTTCIAFFMSIDTRCLHIQAVLSKRQSELVRLRFYTRVCLAKSALVVESYGATRNGVKRKDSPQRDLCF